MIKGSALTSIVDTALKAPRQCIYVYKHPNAAACTFVTTNGKGYTRYTFIGRSRCFVFDLSLNLQDSSTVKTKAYSNAFIVNATLTHHTPTGAFSE